MKNKRLIMTVLLAFVVSFIPISAKAQDNISVTYQVDPYYEVELPSDTDIPFMTEKIPCGTIQIEEALLEEDKCILVEINTSGNLINEDNSKDKIPFQIVSGNNPFTAQKYTKAGESEKLNISIKKEDWEKAAGGNYKTEITFTISYVDKTESVNTTASQITARTTQTVVINTFVPTTHTVAIEAEHASALYVEGDKGLSVAYPVPRFSNPQFKFTAEDGYLIKSILLNGTDVTKEIKNDILMLFDVCENQIIKVETEKVPQETETIPPETEEETKTIPTETEEETKTIPPETEEETKTIPQETEEETKTIPPETEEETKTIPPETEEETKTIPPETEEETKTIPQETEEETKVIPQETDESVTDSIQAQEKNTKHFSFWWIVLPLLSVGIITGIIVLIIKRKKR